MTIGTQEIDLIKSEVASIKEFYDQRMDKEIPPIKEEVDRVATSVREIHERWRRGEKAAILAQYAGMDRPRVAYGKYKGLDMLDLAFMRSLLNAQLRQPIGINPGTLEEWQTNLKAAMDSTTAGTGDELVPTQEAGALWMDVNLETMVAPLFSRVEMPSNPFEIPLQLGDVNWFPGTENIATTQHSPHDGQADLTCPNSCTANHETLIALGAEEVRMASGAGGR